LWVNIVFLPRGPNPRDKCDRQVGLKLGQAWIICGQNTVFLPGANEPGRWGSSWAGLYGKVIKILY